ncbi:MAG TPA: TonB-dependent receptor, partial [Gemmatimonadales bacterium]|nr:TonB-dependent receptor [Gemmatimonadales bacterium]
ATPPPPPVVPSDGTYNSIGRAAGGARVSGTRHLGDGLRLTAGLDLQSMRDNRRNQRSSLGIPTGAVLTDQRETVTEIGPFAQMHWEPTPELLLIAAARWDHLVFNVTDHLLSDGLDNSGKRVMESASGSLGLSHQRSRAATVYANVSTSFESPTTTELVNQANGTVGFNTTLGPQRTVTGEAGVRGRVGGVDYSASGFIGGIRDAIIQAREQDGRAFFENAGKVRIRGLEVGLGAAPVSWLALQGAYTLGSYRFSEYRIPNGAVTDTLDGKRLAGVPKHFFRATATATLGALVLEVDQLTASDVFADDRNTQPVEGWGAGITSFRVSGTITTRAFAVQPFGAVNNAFDRRYVGSVNLNGAAGRILEPAPGRNVYVGMEIAWARR